MDKLYFEVHITPNNFFDIFAGEIIEFTKEAIEEDRASIIVRTSKTKEFVCGLIRHLNELASYLTKINNVATEFDYEIYTKENDDWIKKYQDSVIPIKCGSFYIRPPWANQLNNDMIDLILEPSLAFGSGHHASTYMCIKAIESCNINKKTTLLDVGCGSGILALCANKLGANVSMCDTDELAIEQSIKNFSINNANITKIWVGEINDDDKYDIVVANIVASILIDLKTQLITKLNNNSYLILSGIIDTHKDEILSKFCNLKLVNEYTQDEWVCLKLFKDTD